jgi:potassium-transporting ATPase potassium-binding subunit
MGLGFLQIVLTLIILIILSPLLGRYIANIFIGKKTLFSRVAIPIEKVIFKIAGVRVTDEMTGLDYVRAVLLTNFLMGFLAYLLINSQQGLPFNPTKLKFPSWDLILHTVISFVSNTGQLHYIPEKTVSYFTQTAANGFLMFTSAATGLVVGIAFIRGITGKPIGNFYVDLVRAIIRILLPISIVGAILLLINGVPQTLAGPQTVTTLEGGTQVIARGPVASFEMIKMLGNNGAGFFAANSAHPFENPNGASNLLEIIAMSCIPMALFYTYGIIANNQKQAKLLFWMVFAIFAVMIFVTAGAEEQGNILINNTLNQFEKPNFEGKELRIGATQTAFWAVTSSATMTGAVNGMHDSLTPTGSFVTLLNLFLQIIWGGQGTGIAYLLVYLIIAVFLTGLLVGRSPEFCGRRIEKREVILASLILIVHPLAILLPTAITLAFPNTLAGITNGGFHGISQIVYEYASAASNNGSGLEGLKDNTYWWNLSTAFSILLGRYVPIVAMLLLADGMAQKQPSPETKNTLKTNTLLFTSLTIAVVFVLGILAFFPALALGPIAEGFKLAAG